MKYKVKLDTLSGYYQVWDCMRECVIDSYEWPGDAKQAVKYMNKEWNKAFEA